MWHRLQKVTISESDNTERWIVREAPLPSDIDLLLKKDQQELNSDTQKHRLLTDIHSNRQSNEYNDEFWKNADHSFNSRSGNRLSDIPAPKLAAPIKTRFASDPELNRTEIKHNPIKVETKIPSYELGTNPFQFVEEELYIKGNTVIWSKGLISTPSTEFSTSETRTTICTYTLDNPIKHAVWCTFHSNRLKFESTDFNIRPNNYIIDSSKSFRCISVTDSQKLRVFAENGDDFITNLQIPISNIWPTKYGILLEREENEIKQKNSILEDQTPTIYSLLHPLDELCPVLIKNSGSHTQICCDPTQKIVFANEEPSICMIYDKKTGLHSIYTLRQVRVNEYQEHASTASTSNIQSNMNASIKQKTGNTSLWNLQNIGTPIGSPYCNRASSMLNIVSPQPSRCQSPMTSIRFVFLQFLFNIYKMNHKFVNRSY